MRRRWAGALPGVVLAAVQLAGCASGSGVLRAPASEKFASTTTPARVVCDEVDSTPGERCTVEGAGHRLLIRGTILAPHQAFVGGELLISPAGKIQAVGCDLSSSEEISDTTVIDCPRGIISPGFINLHDHLSYDQSFPADWSSERFSHRHEWRRGLNGHTKLSYHYADSDQQVAWAELRQLMTGTTSVVGSGGVAGFLRNLDRKGLEEGLSKVHIESQVFPLHDAAGVMLEEGCEYPDIDSLDVLTNQAYVPHVSEGITAAARNEILCLSGQQAGGRDLAARNSAFVHALGVLAPDAQLLAEKGTSVVWSPRSNLSLYGNTAPVTLFAALGVNLALSTDWTPSGSANMLRELQCASAFNADYLGGAFSNAQLWAMATGAAADAGSLSRWLGRLEKGRIADVAVFHAADAADPYRAVIDAGMGDVMLVLRGGVAVYGDSDIVEPLQKASYACEVLPESVCGVSKALCEAKKLKVSFGDLQAENLHSYPLVFCNTPPGEPTCTPSRPGEYTGALTADDRDGDGIPNAEDNCPAVFNPIRPLDGGKQADWDEDGVGDVCDPSPVGEMR